MLTPIAIVCREFRLNIVGRRPASVVALTCESDMHARSGGHHKTTRRIVTAASCTTPNMPINPWCHSDEDRNYTAATTSQIMLPFSNARPVESRTLEANYRTHTLRSLPVPLSGAAAAPTTTLTLATSVVAAISRRRRGGFEPSSTLVVPVVARPIQVCVSFTTLPVLALWIVATTERGAAGGVNRHVGALL